MKKNTILLLLLIGTIPPASLKAQWSIGIEGGVVDNYLKTDISNLTFTGLNTRIGFTVAVPLEYRITDWLSGRSGLVYMQKNYEWYRTGYFQGEYENFTNSYLELPLTLQFSFGGKLLRGFFEPGIYAGYWAAGRVKGVLPNELNPVYPTQNRGNGSFLEQVNPYPFNEAYTFQSKEDNRFEFGVSASCGLEYILKTWKAWLRGSLYETLTDQQKKNELGLTPRYNITEALTVGVQVPIRRLLGRK